MRRAEKGRPANDEKRECLPSLQALRHFCAPRSQALPGNALCQRLCLVRQSLQGSGFPGRAWEPECCSRQSLGTRCCSRQSLETRMLFRGQPGKPERVVLDIRCGTSQTNKRV